MARVLELTMGLFFHLQMHQNLSLLIPPFVVYVWLRWQSSINAGGEVGIVFLLLHTGIMGPLVQFLMCAINIFHPIPNWFVVLHE
jgi:hypothetical protein